MTPDGSRACGRRGEVLVTLAALDVVYAIRLFTVDPDLSDFYRWLSGALPMWVWGVLWLAIAAVCVYAAFRARGDRPGFLAALGIKLVWALINVIGYVTGEVADGWVWSAIWLAFAVIVWRLVDWDEPIGRGGGANWTPPSP